jgi:hypothetical protein
VRRLAGDAQRLQVLRAVTVRRGIGDVGKRLWRLADRNGRDDFVRQCVDRRQSVGILQPDIDPGFIEPCDIG